jgi:hypothetical protein
VLYTRVEGGVPLTYNCQQNEEVDPTSSNWYNKKLYIRRNPTSIPLVDADLVQTQFRAIVPVGSLSSSKAHAQLWKGRE